MLNRCEFIGHLGADPEVRRLGSGDPVVNLRLAVSAKWRDKSSGEQRERTTWIPVVIFNEALCKVAEQYLRKGSKVFIAGEFSVRKWTNNSGVEKYSTEIVLQRFRGELQMLDSRKDAGDDYVEQAQPLRDHRRGGGGETGGYGGSGGDLDDEIPFASPWGVW